MSGGDLPEGTLTFLFTDMEGSTRLLQDLPGAYASIVEDQRRLIREAAAANEGVEFGTEGDAVFVVFASATAAVQAAGSAQRALVERSWPEGATVRVRIGVHTGDAEVVEGDYVGLALHVAARVCSAAHGGQVIVTEATRLLAPDAAVLSLGEHRLRDVYEPINLYTLASDGLPTDHPPPRTLSVLPNNLPVPIDEFVGRGLEVVEVAEALRESRLVTLLGPGGVGKTRLALEAAAAVLPQYPDGVWFVELAAATAADQVVAAVASAVRVGERSGEALEATLREQLARRELLLVVDNCEHIVDAAAGIVDRLLHACPSVRALVTSRELLGVRGERALAVRPLDEARELFMTRARSAVRGFDAVGADTDLVESVCVRLDRLPLAIELAAARLRTLSLSQLADRLDDRFRLLTGGSRTATARQRTLEAVVAWSYDLLDEAERATFRMLSIFVDSFDLEGVEAVVAGVRGGSGEALDLVAGLVDKSLLVALPGDDGYRYVMLETLRQYGRERLVELDEATECRRRLLGWALVWVDRLERDMRSPAQDATIAAGNRERSNLRAAFEFALDSDELEAALRIASAVPIAQQAERRAALEDLLERIPVISEAVRANALMTTSILAFEQGEWDAATTAAREAATIFAGIGERRLEAWARYFALVGSWGDGTDDAVRDDISQLLEVFGSLGDDFGLAYTLWTASQRVADLSTADAWAAESERLFRELGSPVGLAHDIEGRALIALRAGDPERAVGFLGEALTLFAGAGNVGCTAHTLEAVAAWLAARGDDDDAGVMLGAAEELRRLSGQGHRPWERDARARTEALLSGCDLGAARAEGRQLGFEAAVARARQVLTSDGPSAVSRENMPSE